MSNNVICFCPPKISRKTADSNCDGFCTNLNGKYPRQPLQNVFDRFAKQPQCQLDAYFRLFVVCMLYIIRTMSICEDNIFESLNNTQCHLASDCWVAISCRKSEFIQTRIIISFYVIKLKIKTRQWAWTQYKGKLNCTHNIIKIKLTIYLRFAISNVGILMVPTGQNVWYSEQLNEQEEQINKHSSGKERQN